jgi:hypothetical protein
MTSLAKAIILGCDTDGCALPGKPPAAGCNHFHLAQGHNQMPYAPSDSLDVDARVDACIEAYIHDLGLTTNDYAVDGAALMTLLTNATKQCKTWSKPKASNLPASDLCKVLANAAMTLPAPPSEVNTNSVTHIAKLHAVYQSLQHIVSIKALLLIVVLMVLLQVMMSTISRKLLITVFMFKA